MSAPILSFLQEIGGKQFETRQTGSGISRALIVFLYTKCRYDEEGGTA